MLRKALDKIVVAWAMIYAAYAFLLAPWFKRHRLDADYWVHMGYAVGLVASVILILIVEATQ